MEKCFYCFNDLIDLGYPSVIALKILTNLSNAVIKRIKNIDIEIILPPIGNDDFVSGENNTNEELFSTINKNLSYFDEDRFVYDDEFFNGEKPINTFFQHLILASVYNLPFFMRLLID